jgi:hypothetical protein
MCLSHVYKDTLGRERLPAPFLRAQNFDDKKLHVHLGILPFPVHRTRYYRTKPYSKVPELIERPRMASIKVFCHLMP